MTLCAASCIQNFLTEITQQGYFANERHYYYQEVSGIMLMKLARGVLTTKRLVKKLDFFFHCRCGNTHRIEVGSSRCDENKYWWWQSYGF